MERCSDSDRQERERALVALCVCVCVCVWSSSFVFSARAVGCELVEVGFETAWSLLTPFGCLCVMVTEKDLFFNQVGFERESVSWELAVWLASAIV